MAKFSSIATNRAEMTVGARDALNALDVSLMQMFDVKTAALPVAYRGKRKRTTFEQIQTQLKKESKGTEQDPDYDPRNVSVKFSGGTIEGTAERLATINKYRDADEDGISYGNIDERGQYEAEVNFCCLLAKWGVLTEDDLQEED